MPGKTLLSFLSIPTTSVQTRKAAPTSAAGSRDPDGEADGPRPQVGGGAQREVDGAVEREQQHEREPGDDRVRA